MKTKLVSIIVVNFNRYDLLAACLDSLAAQDYPACEIVVVDNGSQDGSRAFLAKDPRPITSVFLDHNTGFTGGNIAGLKQSHGEYVALVNNDPWLASEPRPHHILRLTYAEALAPGGIERIAEAVKGVIE